MAGETSYDDIQQLLDDLSERLGRSVSLDDPDGSLITTSRHHGEEDEYRRRMLLTRVIAPEVKRYLTEFDLPNAAGAVRIPAFPSQQFRERVCYPIRSDWGCVGLLWVFDDGSDIPDPRIVALCQQLVRPLDSRRRAKELARAPRKRLLEQVLTGAASSEALELALFRYGHDHDHRCRIAVAADPGPDESVGRTAEGLARALFAYCNESGMGTVTATPLEAHGTAAAIVLGSMPAPAPHSGREAIDRMADLAAVYAPSTKSIGLSPVSELHSIPSTFADAALTSLVGVALFPTEIVVGSEDLGELKDLLHAITTVKVPTIEKLRTLIKDDPTAARTLQVYLQTGGDTTKTAGELSIHRTTLYYRIDRIAEQTGLDLTDGRNRTLTHLVMMAHGLSHSPLADWLQTLSSNQ